ncbi:MmcQ/YjbR family DNA-binding protein [Devosia sp. A16]|uniref:MmcQ/YjbR family DNA-binding protein n=1 Tax=Devosia sp. A16 TaxID=1736675 RepID=UPI001F3C9786|nr:MmcQ/YjbR family DNA-binding protein [Devosia sp. A16]
MATTSSDFSAIALALDGTSEAPHFDRRAFKVARIYATLAADGLTANLRLTPDEQEFKAMLAPEAFVPLDNAWGRQGWTTAVLSELSVEDLRAALEMAHAHALPKTKTKRG